MNELEFSLGYIQSLLDEVISLRTGKRRTIKGFDATGLEWKKKFPKLGLEVDVFYIEPKQHRHGSNASFADHSNGVVQVRGIRGNKKWKITFVCSEAESSFNNTPERIWVTHAYNDALMVEGTTVSNEDNLKADIMALRLFDVIS